MTGVDIPSSGSHEICNPRAICRWIAQHEKDERALLATQYIHHLLEKEKLEAWKILKILQNPAVRCTLC